MSKQFHEKSLNDHAPAVQTQEQISVTVMIEIPKGCRNKYEYDKQKNVIRYDRMIHSSVKIEIFRFGFISV